MNAASTGPLERTLVLVTRFVVVDAVLLVLGALYAVWVSRCNRGSRIKLFSGHRPSGRERWVGSAVIAFFLAGVFLGSAGYGPRARVVDILVFLVALICPAFLGHGLLRVHAASR